MAVTIGIDPHKGSHTAVALDEHEADLGQLRVRSGPEQLARLSEWAKAWPERTWAVENASGLGYLLAQQLVAAGERVVDVPPKLAARARLLDNGDVNKNDPNDARSVAVAALRAKRLSEVTKEDHAAVMRLWARRRKDLTSARTRVANRLHAVILELVPGGYAGEIYASQSGAPARGARAGRRRRRRPEELAEELLGDLRRLDGQLNELKERLAAVVAASGTTTTKIFGVGPVVAAITVGLTGDVRPLRRQGPLRRVQRHRPDRGLLGREEDLPPVHEGQPPAEPRPPHGGGHPGPPHATARAGPTTTARSPRARPARRPSGRSNGASATPSTPPWWPTPAGPSRSSPQVAREGKRGTAQ